MKRIACSLLLLVLATASTAAPPNVLYISHASQNRVSVVDRGSGDVLTTIELPGGQGSAFAWGIHGDRNAERIYVARNVGSAGDIVTIDGSTNTPLSTFSIGTDSAYAPAVERSGRILNLLTHSGVSQYDVTNGFALVDAVPLLGLNSNFGIARTIRSLWVANQSTRQLIRLRERPLSVSGTVQLSCIPGSVSVNPRGLDHVAATCSGKVVEVKTGIVTTEHFADNPNDLAFGPGDKFLWVGEGTGLRRINIRNDEAMAIPLGTNVYAVAALDGRVFAVGEDRLLILDEETGAVLADRSLNGGSPPITGNALFVPCSRRCGSVN